MIYPKGIKKGDTIGIVAPSGPFRATTLGEIENTLNNLIRKRMVKHIVLFKLKSIHTFYLTP